MFYNLFHNFFFANFFNILKCLKIRQRDIIKKNKENIFKSPVKDIKIFLKKKRTKSKNIVVNDRRISQKMKSKISKHFHNIWRLFDVLPIFFLSQVKQFMIITYKYDEYKLPQVFLNHLRLRNLGTQEILGKYQTLQNNTLVPSFPAKV